MNEFLGNLGDKITVNATLVRLTSYYNAYGAVGIYIFLTENNDCVVWKTSTDILLEKDSEWGRDLLPIERGDFVEITGTVKGHSTYKDGTKQTNLLRCKVNYLGRKEVVDKYKTKHELWVKEQKSLAEVQLASLSSGDFIWKQMPYKQYKEHYSDCETVKGSYRDNGSMKVIDVIIRSGRLKNSGVRGQHYCSYTFRNPDTGKTLIFKAMSEENARKQLKKAYPRFYDTMVLVDTSEYSNYDWFCYM